MEISGRILHLQRLSTEDGPGIRTTVFFKGCPLRCAWCHNPESLSPRVQIQWFKERCLGCNTCLKSCPEDNLQRGENGLEIDRQHCQGCPICADACPANAIEVLGQPMTVDDLLKELLKDRAYYEKSGGGVTVSGGEPTLQPEFAEALLRSMKEAGIATALDTCGLCAPVILERLLPHVDLVLFDLKLLDSEGHRRYTSQPNPLILENLLLVRDLQRRADTFQLWMRTPLIPGATDDDCNLRSIGAFLSENMEGAVSRWELCAFNNLCRDKYTRLGMHWDFANQPLMSQEELFRCETAAKTSGVDPGLVLVTGLTRING
jgi:pyruvate formate lyase activating enzyme